MGRGYFYKNWDQHFRDNEEAKITFFMLTSIANPFGTIDFFNPYDGPVEEYDWEYMAAHIYFRSFVKFGFINNRYNVSIQRHMQPQVVIVDGLKYLFDYSFFEIDGSTLKITADSIWTPKRHNLSPKIRKIIIKRDLETCRYGPHFEGPWHIDHVIPICQNGTDELDNLALSCSKCNHHKRGRTPYQAGMFLYPVGYFEKPQEKTERLVSNA